MMRSRLLQYVDDKLLSKVAIHFSRPRNITSDVTNILYCHDLANDGENRILLNEGWKAFDHFVFVSHWQRDQYILLFKIPYSKTTVIPNAVEQFPGGEKDFDGPLRFIYHTTPHRGLHIAYSVFDELTKKHSRDMILEVFSSFAIYGWKERDEQYQYLYHKIATHPNMVYHGSQPNSVVRNTLQNSHVFLYPSIWPETSCIALIEAIKSGCVSIHSNLGALPETAESKTMMYDFTENEYDHAQRCFDTCDAYLKTTFQQPVYINNADTHSIEKFTHKWTMLLERLI